MIRRAIAFNAQNKTQLVKTAILNYCQGPGCAPAVWAACAGDQLCLCADIWVVREMGKTAPKLLLRAGLEFRPLPVAWSHWLGLSAAFAVVGPGCCHPTCSTLPVQVLWAWVLGGEATDTLSSPALVKQLSLGIPDSPDCPAESSAFELCMQNSWNCSWGFLMWELFCPEPFSEFVLSITV